MDRPNFLLMALALPGFLLLILTASFPRTSLLSLAGLITSILLGIVLNIPGFWTVPLIFMGMGSLTIYFATRLRVEFKWDFQI